MSEIIHAKDLGEFTPAKTQKTYILIKEKGFNPNPIAGKIPAFANISVNPDVVGSRLYEEFWEEQVSRCRNGYTTGGIKIPGRYYFYMNFQPLAGVTGGMYPLYCELDREFYLTVDWVKEYGKVGVISLKARRRGLSEKIKGGVINYGITFEDKYRAGVFAGIDTYVQGIKKKIINGLTGTVDDMRLSILKNNEKQLKLGYEERIFGSFVESGCLAEVQFETMFNSAVKMEGEYFNDVISEESGENPNLKDAFESIKPALMFGSQVKGTFYIYGTAGNILSGSKDFIEMYRHHEEFDLVKLWIPGTRLYYPFFVTKKNDLYKEAVTGETIDPIKNIRPLVDKYGVDRLLGCEDLEQAEKNVSAMYKKYEKLDDKKNLIELKKNFPLNEDDAITSGGSNNFNNELLFSRLNHIQMNGVTVGKFVLEFVYDKTENGDMALRIPLEVKPRIPTEKDEDWKIVNILQHPIKNMRNVDAMGVDSYNQDMTNTSDSLGGFIVIRDGRELPSMVNNVPIRKGLYPVCWYQERPPKKELFYEICLKTSVYYGLIRDTMISAEHDFLIDYYKKNGGKMYLAYRPRSFDSPNTEALYEYGAKFNTNKGRIIGIIQSFIEDWIHLCDAEVLIREMIAFDEINIGSDWDIVDALGYCLMRIIERKGKPQDKDASDESSCSSVEWERRSDGSVVLKDVVSNDNDDFVMFGDKKITI